MVSACLAQLPRTQMTSAGKGFSFAAYGDLRPMMYLPSRKGISGPRCWPKSASMEAYAVNRAVNSVKNDTEECIEPVPD